MIKQEKLLTGKRKTLWIVSTCLLKSEVSNWKFSTFLENNNNKFNKNDILNVLTKQDMDEAYQIISGWNNYSPTPLISLNKLSKELNTRKNFL